MRSIYLLAAITIHAATVISSASAGNAPVTVKARLDGASYVAGEPILLVLKSQNHTDKLYVWGRKAETPITGDGGLGAFNMLRRPYMSFAVSNTRVDDSVLDHFCDPHPCLLGFLAINGTRVTSAGLINLAAPRGRYSPSISFLQVSPNQLDQNTRAALVKAFKGNGINIRVIPNSPKPATAAPDKGKGR